MKQLRDAIDAGEVAAARTAYIRARPYFEKIEPVARSFVVGGDDLDADIDARINDVPYGRWQGFHRIERGLFAFDSVTGLRPYAAGLVGGRDALVAARFRADVLDVDRARDTAPPDGLQGRHERRQASGHRGPRRLRVGRR